MRVAVVGCGYVGLVSAVGLASGGHCVTGIESDAGRRQLIADGTPPFHEPGLTNLLGEVLTSGTFEVSGDIGRVAEAEVILLAVQTPPDRGGAIDLEPLTAAAKAVGQVLACDDRFRVVATRSTVLPGTTDQVVQPLLDCEDGGATTAAASNPEFLREGSAVDDFLHPDRVVIGCTTNWGAQLLEKLYAAIGASVVITAPATAELAKYTSNAFLATLISFSNEIARVCEDFPGVDVQDVLGILHKDRRWRLSDNSVEPAILSYLQAGCGYGGSCLPKDLSALISARRSHGSTSPLLEAVREINDTQPSRFVELAERSLGGLAGKRCAVLGLAFKAGTDDVRHSPGLAAVRALAQRAGSVVAFDPLVDERTLAAAGFGPLELATTLEEALAGADACLVTTTAPEFTRLPALVQRYADPPVVVDGRRSLLAEDFPPGSYVAVGRSSRRH